MVKAWARTVLVACLVLAALQWFGAPPGTANVPQPVAVAAYIPSNAHTFTQSVTFSERITATPGDPSTRVVPHGNDPALGTNDPGVFYVNQFNLPGAPPQAGSALSSGVGYVGLQAQSLAIFSVWGARGCRTADTAAFCTPFDEGGAGFSVRKSVPWKVGYTYGLTLTAGLDGWWTAAVTGLGPNPMTLGSLQMPVGTRGVQPAVGWIEFYHAYTQGCGSAPNAAEELFPVRGDRQGGQDTVVNFADASGTNCSQYAVATVAADGSAMIGAYPQGTRIANAHTGMCLAVARVVHAAPVRSAPCGQAGTTFWPQQNADGRTVTIYADPRHTLSLDTPYETRDIGAQLVIGVPTGHASQRWQLRPSPAGGTSFALLNDNSKLTVDVAYHGNSAMTPMTQGIPARTGVIDGYQAWTFRS